MTYPEVIPGRIAAHVLAHSCPMERMEVPFDIGTWKGTAEVTYSPKDITNWSVVAMTAAPYHEDGTLGEAIEFIAGRETAERLDLLDEADMTTLGNVIDTAIERHDMGADAGWHERADAWKTCPGRGRW